MHDIIRFVGDFFVLVLVAFPPFLYLYQYMADKIRSIWLRLLLIIIYWGGTVLLSNLVPALVVLFLIVISKKEKAANRLYDEEDEFRYEIRKFKLDCTGPKWKFSLSTFIKISLWGILIKSIVTYINIIFVALLQRFNLILESQEVVNDFLRSNLWRSAIFFIIIVIGAPIVEEFVFRFWIYDRLLKPRINSFLAALFTNLLFMAAHFNLQGAVAFFLVGIINCFLYDRKGYWAAVANHFMFNFITVILLISVKLFNIPLE